MREMEPANRAYDGRTVLIVDDHALVRSTLRGLLTEEFPGLTVAEAESAERAIAIASTHCPSAVVMDISLPGMGGIEATARIKERWAHVPVLMHTIHDLDAYRQDALQAGADGYIVKGKGYAGFLSALGRALETEAKNTHNHPAPRGDG